MVYKIALTLVIAFPSIVFGNDISFVEAKKLADKYESYLQGNETQLLVKAQGDVARNSFPYCINLTKSAPTNFTVVLKLSSSGKVMNSWLSGDSSFAKCFHSQFRKTLNYKPSSVLFYTSFEYKNTP